MSTFGTTEKVSGHIEINTGIPSQKVTYTGKGIKRPSFPWNDRSTQSFKDVLASGVSMDGKESYYNGWGFTRSVMSNKGAVGNWLKPGFMEKCDLRQGPVKHIIYNMIRLKAREYNEESGEPTGKIKEYLTFEMRHEGKDWLGRKVASPQIIEGVYQKMVTKTEIVEFNSRTGDPSAETMLGDPVIVHYIEWQGKKSLDKIFKTWPGSENTLDRTLFYVKTGDGFRDSGFRNADLSYEQFVNSEWEHLKWLAERLGGPSGSHNLGISPEKALYSACTCSNCKKQARNTSVQ